jgi:hypothetical protein
MAYTTIDLPTEYFNTVLYTGNGTAIGSGGQSITGVGFSPEFTWIKERSSTSPHKLLDIIRGATKELESNTTNVEATEAESLASFDSDGFTVGSNGAVNENTQTYASWNWLANGAGVSNTAGDIASTVSANTTAGFSIVSFDLTGQTGVKTVGHGLGTAPKVVITKRRSGGAGDWTSYFGAIGNSYLVLNSTAAGATNADFMNNTAPTSSVFTVGDPTWWAQSPFIAYCFAEVKGYSKFGSYAGNNNADGTFVYTGFSPSFVLVKRYGGGTQNWVIYDNKRNTYNLTDSTLRPNTSGAEATNNGVDLLSNGFKFRSSDGDSNGYSDGYIYMAFAEHPFVTSTGIPTTAR